MHWLQIWPPDGTTCISYKLDHQVESLASVAKLSTRWRHLHELQIWPPDGATRNVDLTRILPCHPSHLAELKFTTSFTFNSLFEYELETIHVIHATWAIQHNNH